MSCDGVTTYYAATKGRCVMAKKGQGGLSKAAAALGHRGGNARKEVLTPARRAAIARQGGKAKAAKGARPPKS